MKLETYIKKAKELIEMSHNQLNLENYKKIIEKKYSRYIKFYDTDSKQPIKLMSGQHKNAGIISRPSINFSKRKIYLVGKGILFDAGGYNLKPTGHIETMKIDMAGMAIAFAVDSYFRQINSTQFNVIACCPIATNFIHNNLITPGDYIKIGKKVVEVTNTDAEGRLILAETLSQLDVKPNDIVITIATLTGCVMYAVGKKATGVFTDNNKLAVNYLQSAEEAKELAWRLPMWDYIQKKHYDKKTIKNAIKDVKAGATQGAMFIKQFVQYPKNWLHLDIASSAYNDEKGKATGEPIKTLVKFIEKELK